MLEKGMSDSQFRPLLLVSIFYTLMGYLLVQITIVSDYKSVFAFVASHKICDFFSLFLRTRGAAIFNIYA